MSIRELIALGAVCAWLVCRPAAADERKPADDNEETSGWDDDAFRIGGSCAGLAFVSRAQIEKQIAMALADELHAFCYAEEPFDCSDYTGLLKGTGSMVAGDDGFFCALRVERRAER